MVNMTPALNAYNSQMKLAKSADEMLGNDNKANGASFMDLLTSQISDVVSTQNAAEKAQVDALSGTGDITDLVTAIANAELALNTIVTIRDKAISAYQDIIRMPI